MKNNQTFKQWLKDTYDKDELQGIADHGCQSGVGGMIYYTETCALYDKHVEELHDMIYQYEQETGEYPQYIIENLGCLTGFKNAIVWFCAELIAQELTNAWYDSDDNTYDEYGVNTKNSFNTEN